MSKPTDQPDRPPPTRRRYQYGLGTLFMLTLVVSVACSVGAELARARGNRLVEYFVMVAAAPLLLLMGVGVWAHFRDGRTRKKTQEPK